MSISQQSVVRSEEICVDLGASVGPFGRGPVSISEQSLVGSWNRVSISQRRSCVDLSAECVDLERRRFYSM